jgi:hypothetical protein
VPTGEPAAGSQTVGTDSAHGSTGDTGSKPGTSVGVGNCVIGSNDTNIDCSGDKAQQGLGSRLHVSHSLGIACAMIALLPMLVFGDNCDYGNNDSGNNCINNTDVTNPPQSDATGQEGNRIALGVGIGIGIPAFIVSLIGLIQCKRKGWLC